MSYDVGSEGSSGIAAWSDRTPTVGYIVLTMPPVVVGSGTVTTVGGEGSGATGGATASQRFSVWVA